MSKKKILTLSQYKASHPRLGWFYGITAALKWLLVVFFSVILATNLGGGSFFTLSKFKLGSFVFPPPAIIALFAFAALGFMFAYSTAILKRMKRWHDQFDTLVLRIDRDADKERKQSFYLISFFKYVAQAVYHRFSDALALTQLEFFETKVIGFFKKLGLTDKTEAFYKKRQLERSQRFIERHRDEFLLIKLLENSTARPKDKEQLEQRLKKLKKQLKQRLEILNERDAFLTGENEKPSIGSAEKNGSTHAWLKENFLKETTIRPDINLFQLTIEQWVETQVHCLNERTEFSKPLSAQNLPMVWQALQSEECNVRLQVRELCDASDDQAYQTFLSFYKALRTLYPKADPRPLEYCAVACFRILRVMHLKEKETIVRALAEENLALPERNSESMKKQYSAAINTVFNTYYHDSFDQKNKKTLTALIQKFFVQTQSLNQDFLMYEEKARKQDAQTFERFLVLEIIKAEQKKTYLQQHRVRRQQLRKERLAVEFTRLTESASYHLAPKSCLRLAKQLRVRQAKADHYRFAGRWTRVFYRMGICFGLVNAFSNGFFGFLGILSLTTKLLHLPLPWVNVCVVLGASCAVLASLCLTFPRVLTVFRAMGFSIDTLGVTRLRNKGAVIWGAVSSLGAGLVSGSFVFLSLIVSTYFIVDQTGWVYLTMTPVLMLTGLVLGLGTLVGATSLYRPELTNLSTKFITPILRWWHGLQDPFDKQSGVFEKSLKTLVASICVTAFITAAVTARVALPHAIEFIVNLLFSMNHVPELILWPLAGFGIVCSSLAIGIFVTTQQWRILGNGLGRYLDNTAFGSTVNYVFGFDPIARAGVWDNNQWRSDVTTKKKSLNTEEEEKNAELYGNGPLLRPASRPNSPKLSTSSSPCAPELMYENSLGEFVVTAAAGA